MAFLELPPNVHQIQVAGWTIRGQTLTSRKMTPTGFQLIEYTDLRPYQILNRNLSKPIFYFLAKRENQEFLLEAHFSHRYFRHHYLNTLEELLNLFHGYPGVEAV